LKKQALRIKYTNLATEFKLHHHFAGCVSARCQWLGGQLKELSVETGFMWTKLEQYLQRFVKICEFKICLKIRKISFLNLWSITLKADNWQYYTGCIRNKLMTKAVVNCDRQLNEVIYITCK